MLYMAAGWLATGTPEAEGIWSEEGKMPVPGAYQQLNQIAVSYQTTKMPVNKIPR